MTLAGEVTLKAITLPAKTFLMGPKRGETAGKDPQNQKI
jgi:hypothetical protein